MLAQVTHDLKNPILSTRFLIKQIKKLWNEKKDFSVDDYKLIKYNLDDALNLIHSILDYTHLNVSDLKLSIRTFSLPTCL